MNWKEIYPYCNTNLIDQPHHYHYTQFRGLNLFEAWRTSRLDAVSRLKSDRLETEVEQPAKDNREDILTRDVLQDLIDKFSLGVTDHDDDLTIHRLVQKFEVSKKVYSVYTKNWKRKIKGQHHDLRNYILLGQVFSLAYESTRKLYYLNALLKLLDILSSVSHQLPTILHSDFKSLLDQEEKFVKQLADLYGVCV